MSVVLPAPFGPSKAKAEPAGTTRSTSSTIDRPLLVLESRSQRIASTFSFPRPGSRSGGNSIPPRPGYEYRVAYGLYKEE